MPAVTSKASTLAMANVACSANSAGSRPSGAIPNCPEINNVREPRRDFCPVGTDGPECLGHGPNDGRVVRFDGQGHGRLSNDAGIAIKKPRTGRGLRMNAPVERQRPRAKLGVDPRRRRAMTVAFIGSSIGVDPATVYQRMPAMGPLAVIVSSYQVAQVAKDVPTSAGGAKWPMKVS